MIVPTTAWLRRGLAGWLAAGVVVSIATMTWFGYRAVEGWQESAALLGQRRAGETANLLVTALTRDMRGVQTAVLSSPRTDEFMLDPPYDVRDLAASAFARYPYPESFFAWLGVPSPDSVVFFDRVERRPAWVTGAGGTSRFPVVVGHYPEVARALFDRIASDAAERRRFSTFELQLGGVSYHVVARLLYRDALREHLEGVFGFTVNLPWTRQRYFHDVTRQVARINDAGRGLSLSVLDERGRQVASVPGGATRGATVRRTFPMVFFDPLVVDHGGPGVHPRLAGTVEVSVGDDATLAGAVRAGNRTLFLLAGAASALGLGLVLTLRATRASARLAELRSDFVSTVTHELKTPIATIRAVGDTLARDRIPDPETRHQYARLVVQEAKRLTRLVDNLLAYSRMTDVTDTYSFEPIDVPSIVEDALQAFGAQLFGQGFEVHVDVPSDLPPVRGDRTAIGLMLDNLIDNAIRYSGEGRWIGVSARHDGSMAVIEVRDRGIGIPRDEIAHVMRRFFRGRRAGSGGSGLGLAIVSRIVTDHGGTIAIESAVGAGTVVRVTLQLVRSKAHEEAHPGR